MACLTRHVQGHDCMYSHKQRHYAIALCSACGHVLHTLVALMQYSITLYFTTCSIMYACINKASLLCCNGLL